MVFFGDYIESKELLLRQKAELAEIKSELMLSQLNPHFVANTLNSIVALCRFDPPEAEKATRLFAGYLRWRGCYAGRWTCLRNWLLA